MKTKQQIYARILQHGLIGIHNRSGHASYCHVMADFLHNIPQYILDEGWEDTDFYFLNVEVSSYVASCQHLHVPADPTLLSLAADLRAIVSGSD